MRRFSAFLICALILSFAAASAFAQGQTFTSDKLDYQIDFPSATWRTVSEPDTAHQHLEFVYGDRNDGHLRVRKEVVEAGTTPSDLARRDQEQKLRFLTGYVDGKEERFAGRMNGVVFTYEYTSGGKVMGGRTYYLQADNRTIYTVRFTGQRDKLLVIRNQTDNIARSFRLK